jgi:transcriptional regulator with XRE-family HTH domain
MPPREDVQVIQGYGERLLARLRALRLSQSALATKAEVSRQTLHRAIHHDELTPRVAKKIAGVVGKDFAATTATGAGGGSTTPLRLVPTGATGVLAVGPKDTGDAEAPVPAAVREEIARYVAAPDAEARWNLSPAARDVLEAEDDAWLQTRRLTPLGEVLELLRQDLSGASQQAFALDAGISVTTYRRLLTGEAKPKKSWLRAFGENLDLDDPKSMTHLAEFTGSDDPLDRAIGQQLRTWRAMNGYDLHDVADATGEHEVFIARAEVGDVDSNSMLGELAPLYGTTADVLFAAAQLAAAPNTRESKVASVARVLSLEGAFAEARRKERERASDRTHGWDFEGGFEMSNIRRRAGWEQEDVAKRLGVTVDLVEAWEEGEVEPSTTDFEIMATMYVVTPWELRYGSRWARAWEFPAAAESRAFLFQAIFSPAELAWLYRFLAEVAALGLDVDDVESIRLTLTNPNGYGELTEHVPREAWERFIRIRLRTRAEHVWRNLREPGWPERPRDTWGPLPALFHEQSQEERDQDVAILEAAVEQRARAAAKRRAQVLDEALSGRVGSPPPAALAPDPPALRVVTEVMPGEKDISPEPRPDVPAAAPTASPQPKKQKKKEKKAP